MAAEFYVRRVDGYSSELFSTFIGSILGSTKDHFWMMLKENESYVVKFFKKGEMSKGASFCFRFTKDKIKQFYV